MTGESTKPSERLGIAGSGAIACGLANVAGEAVLWARSQGSAERARSRLPERVTVTTDLEALAGCGLVVEAVAEDLEVKSDLLAKLHPVVPERTLLLTTTSSLHIAELAQASGRPDRFAALHVFNPVERMDLVELAFTDDAGEDTRRRVWALCDSLGKTGVEVPAEPGFVVNRLLFPFLFNAVRLMDETELQPEDLDTCVKLGAAHPMGPLALLDFIGLDVAAAIGGSMGLEVPERMSDLIARGALGRKSGGGFYSYG